MKHLSVLIVVLLFTDNVKFLLLFCFRFAIFPSPQLLSSLEVLVVFIQMWEWGVGSRESGQGAGEAGEVGGDEGDKGTKRITNLQSPMPNAQSPIPNSQSHPICTKINDLSHKESNHGIHPRVAPTAG
jgi:hypothetical protein